MRPRVFPAEDVDCRHESTAISAASMRPRVFPAEDLVDPRDHVPAHAMLQ